MARLWAKTVSFDSISVGDQLPILVKWDTRETVDRLVDLLALSPHTADQHDSPVDKEATDQDNSGDVVVPGPAIVAYIAELLEKAFPIANILARGSHLEVHLTAPVRPEDTLTFTGEIAGKREENDFRLVESAITVENQHGQTVARAVAVVSL
jgi:acyl dehydratase